MLRQKVCNELSFGISYNFCLVGFQTRTNSHNLTNQQLKILSQISGSGELLSTTLQTVSAHSAFNGLVTVLGCHVSFRSGTTHHLGCAVLRVLAVDRTLKSMGKQGSSCMVAATCEASLLHLTFTLIGPHYTPCWMTVVCAHLKVIYIPQSGAVKLQSYHRKYLVALRCHGRRVDGNRRRSTYLQTSCLPYLLQTPTA